MGKSGEKVFAAVVEIHNSVPGIVGGFGNVVSMYFAMRGELIAS